MKTLTLVLCATVFLLVGLEFFVSYHLEVEHQSLADKQQATLNCQYQATPTVPIDKIDNLKVRCSGDLKYQTCTYFYTTHRTLP